MADQREKSEQSRPEHAGGEEKEHHKPPGDCSYDAALRWRQERGLWPYCKKKE